MGYGQGHSPEDILGGDVDAPKAAEPLYGAIFKYINDPYSNHTGPDAAGGGTYDPYAMPDPTLPKPSAPVSSGSGSKKGASNIADDTIFDLDDLIGSVHV